MSSPQDWVWDAFSLYDSLFSHMPPFILRMNTRAKVIGVETSKFKRFVWCCSVFINVIIILCGSSLYAIGKWFIRPKSMLPMQAAASLGILAIGILAGYTCLVHYIYREEHSLGVNIVLRQNAKANAKGSRKKKPNATKETDMKQIIFGGVMKGMVWGFWFTPVIVPIGIFEGLDPLRTLLLDIVPEEWMDKYPVHVTLTLLLARFFLLTIAAMEITRFYAMFFLLFISGIAIYLDSIDKLLVKSSKSSLPLTSSNFETFRCIRLVIQILTPILRREICCLMFTGFFIAVGACIGTVQCYEIFPWYMYYTFVLGYIVTMAIIYCTLPFGTDVNEKTTFTLEKWADKLQKCNPYCRKALQTNLKSLVPVFVQCGPFFKLKRETKSTYFDAIFSISCDFNLSVDIKAIFENGL